MKYLSWLSDSCWSVFRSFSAYPAHHWLQAQSAYLAWICHPGSSPRQMTYRSRAQCFQSSGPCCLVRKASNFCSSSRRITCHCPWDLRAANLRQSIATFSGFLSYSSQPCWQLGFATTRRCVCLILSCTDLRLDSTIPWRAIAILAGELSSSWWSLFDSTYYHLMAFQFASWN